MKGLNKDIIDDIISAQKNIKSSSKITTTKIRRNNSRKSDKFNN